MKIVTIWDTLLFGVLAMSVVFGVLALLGFIISLFKTFFYSKTKPPEGKIEKKEEVKEEKLVEVKNKKKIAAIAASISMYLQSSVRVKPKMVVSTESELTNIWKLKGVLAKRANQIKERRWRNG